WLPGVPQVYYVGLLAGHNDMDLLARSGVGRDINRHHYSPAEITAALQRPVVADLCRLIRLRNAHPAFQGRFSLLPSDDETLAMQWADGPHSATLTVNLRSRAVQVQLQGPDGSQAHPLQQAAAAGSPAVAL
ncbi:MAG: sucrose phosphorylase, partial [Burkholderiales bacterium PBB5]